MREWGTGQRLDAAPLHEGVEEPDERRVLGLPRPLGRAVGQRLGLPVVGQRPDAQPGRAQPADRAQHQ
eukprot:SAG11_NODE_1248_length_5396_cov_2.091372_1_plen_67_part_10